MEKLITGASVVYEAVSSTMGPQGKLVIFNGAKGLYPNVTKDGVTVARSIVLPDEAENLGAEMLVQAAQRQVIETGDGTTLTTVLAFHLMTLSYKMVQAGHNPADLIKEMGYAVQVVVDQVNSESTLCKNQDELESIASIAANNDHELGHIIAEAVYNTGEYGSIIWDKNHDQQHSVEYEEGYQWEVGITDVLFANIDSKFMYWGEPRKPFILVVDEIIKFGEDLLPIVQKIRELDANILGKDPESLTLKEVSPLIIICPDVIAHALAVLANSITDNMMFLAFIRPAGQIGTKERIYCMRDIAAMTGAKFVQGGRLKDLELDDLGACQFIHSDHKKTIIKGGYGKPKDRANILINLIDSEQLEGIELEYAKKSAAKLNGGMAKIHVGGKTETEQEEKLDRVDDSVHACRSAQKAGVVAGGGVALLLAKKKLKDLLEMRPGYRIVSQAIEAPAFKILSNADNADTQAIIADILRDRTSGYRIDERNQPDEHFNMFDLNVIDPALVITKALENAFSVAKMVINTATSITTMKPD